MNANVSAAGARELPWYRERWPWFLLSGPAIVVIAGFASAYLAVRSDDGVVAQDYYKRGLLINRELAKTERASGIAALASFDRDGAVHVRLEGADARPAQLRLRVAHPTREGLDRVALLTLSADGTYFGRIMPVPTGRWLVTLDTEAWRMPSIEVMAPFNVLRLGAAGTRG